MFPNAFQAPWQCLQPCSWDEPPSLWDARLGRSRRKPTCTKSTASYTVRKSEIKLFCCSKKKTFQPWKVVTNHSPISCLCAKPVAGGGTMMGVDTACDWLNHFMAVLAFCFGRSNTVLKLFCFSFISIVQTVSYTPFIEVKEPAVQFTKNLNATQVSTGPEFNSFLLHCWLIGTRQSAHAYVPQPPSQAVRRLQLKLVQMSDGATTLSRMNLSGYVGRVTYFSWMFTIACCLVVELGLGLDLVSGW